MKMRKEEKANRFTDRERERERRRVRGGDRESESFFFFNLIRIITIANDFLLKPK